MRKRLAEKAKDGTLKANGEPKPAPKKRPPRWDQRDDAPVQKKLCGTSATPTSWDNDVCLLHYLYIILILLFKSIEFNLKKNLLILI